MNTKQMRRFAACTLSALLAFVLCASMFAPAAAYGLDNLGNGASEQGGQGTQGELFALDAPDDENGEDGEPGGGTGGSGGTDPGTGGSGSGGTDPGDGSGGSGGTDPGDGTGGGTDPGTGGGTGGTTYGTLMELNCIAFSTDASGNWVKELNSTLTYKDSLEGYSLNGGLGTKGAQIRLMVVASWSNGATFSQNEPGWLDIGAIRWSSSNTALATVDYQGVVTALGDGTVTIAAQALSAEGNVVTGYFFIDIFGQNGAFVTSVKVCYEDGTEYGNTYITIKELGASLQFYARLYFSDGHSECSAPGAADKVAEFSAGSLSWWSEREDVGYINAESGYFISRYDGDTVVRLTSTGGDPTKYSGQVWVNVYIAVDTGLIQEGGRVPQDTLKIQVLYSDKEFLRDIDESIIAEEFDFSLAQLQAIETATATYTLVKENGPSTYDAQGIYLSTLFDYLKIAPSDIFTLKFVDRFGYGSDRWIPNTLYTSTRYYFPLIDNGNNTNSRMAVAPMIAYKDSLLRHSYEHNYEGMDGRDCFRFFFGSLDAAEYNAGYSVYNAYVMKIVLKGAPPLRPGDDDGNGGGGNNDKPGTGNGGGGTGKPGTGNGGGGTGKPGTGGGGGGITESNGSSNNNLTSGSEGQVIITNGLVPLTSLPTQESSDTSAAASANSSNGADEAEAPAANSAGGHRWQVFEMMSNLQSDVPPIPFTNPLEPFMLPATLSVALVGGLFSFTRYRRRVNLALA